MLLVWLVGSMGINLLPLFCMGAGPRSNELLGTWILEDDEMIYVSVMIESYGVSLVRQRLKY